ncbi:MAG: hypothetical protein QXX57_01595 [Nitrososphaerota archaeon]
MNSIQAEMFLRTLVEAFGRHPVWTDGAPWYHRYRFGDWLWRGLYRHSRIEPFPMQEEGMHSRACLEMAKPHPHTHPARYTKPDEQHKRGDEDGLS